MVNTDKLTQDARLARDLAVAAGIMTVDNGTANLDSTFFRLGKGDRAEQVVKALRAAGLIANETRWIGRGVIVAPPGAGQANKRYAANQALYESLRGCGWPVTPYYQMD